MTTDPWSLAQQALPQVTAWTTGAVSGIERSYPLPAAGVDEVVLRTREAMEVHFHISQAAEGQQAVADAVKQTYQSILATLSDGIAFESVSEAEARDDNNTPPEKDPPPAYTRAGEYIRLSPFFREYDASTDEGEGPLCRATIIMHELAHFTDEYIQDYKREYEPGYDTLDSATAVHNAACYTAFAQHVASGVDERYGSGRRSE